MAIQVRRGQYVKLDKRKLVPGEHAVVLEGDPYCEDGKSVYICFSAGDTKRMATYEDMLENIENSSGEIIDKVVKQSCDKAIQNCQTAASAANTAKANADKATESATSAASAANTAKTKADAAAKRAEEAAAACEALVNGTKVAELEKQMQQVIAALKNVLSTD